MKVQKTNAPPLKPPPGTKRIRVDPPMSAETEALMQATEIPPELAEKITKGVGDKRTHALQMAARSKGLNLPSELAELIRAKTYEKPGPGYVERGPITAQAAYTKFRKEIGASAGKFEKKSYKNDLITFERAKQEYPKFVNRNFRNNATLFYNKLGKHYAELREYKQQNTKVKKTRDTGYFRNPFTNRMIKTDNMGPKRAQYLGVNSRSRVCKKQGIVKEVLCYIGIASDGSCKRCRVESLPKGNRILPDNVFWSPENRAQARSLPPKNIRMLTQRELYERARHKEQERQKKEMREKREQRRRGA